jgi:phage protein D
LKAWPSYSDSDIASEIFSSYGLTPQVEDTNVVHDEQVSTIIQRETDIQFLKRLALRNGFECFVDGDTGYFQSPQLDADSQPVLTAVGDDANVNRIQFEVNALATADVAMTQVDHDTKGVLDSSSTAGEQKSYGTQSADSFLGPNMPSGLVHVGKVVTTGNTEMDALTQGLFNEGEWFVTGEGEVAANDYGNVLMPRAPVTIKGIGKTFSGVYYVTHVTHIFNSDGYTQRFRIKRNGLMPTGSEVFSTNGGSLLAAL